MWELLQCADETFQNEAMLSSSKHAFFGLIYRNAVSETHKASIHLHSFQNYVQMEWSGVTLAEWSGVTLAEWSGVKLAEWSGEQNEVVWH